MKQLPLAARVYVASVIVAGAIVMAMCLPLADFTHQPVLFAALVALASASAALKVTLPLTTSGSTMSVSYAVDFAALLLLGPHEAMVVAAASAFCQCHVNNKEKNPAYRTLFSMAALVADGAGRGARAVLADGSGARPARRGDRAPAGRRGDGVFPPEHRTHRDGDRAVDATSRSSTTWQTNFLWSAPSYFVGAGTAAMAAMLVTKTGYWFAPLGFAPIYLTYRTYKVYMGRIEDEQRHVQQTSDLHLATIEALARAIDAKDQNTQMHIRRVQMYAAAMAKAVGLSPAGDSGRQDRGAASRHRQAGRARAHPVEAGSAHAGRVPEDPHPSRSRRRDHRGGAVSRIPLRRSSSAITSAGTAKAIRRG